MKRLIVILVLMNSTLLAESNTGITMHYVDYPMKEGKGMYSTK